jgi:hypothetical protein
MNCGSLNTVDCLAEWRKPWPVYSGQYFQHISENLAMAASGGDFNLIFRNPTDLACALPSLRSLRAALLPAARLGPDLSASFPSNNNYNCGYILRPASGAFLPLGLNSLLRGIAA